MEGKMGTKLSPIDVYWNRIAGAEYPSSLWYVLYFILHPVRDALNISHTRSTALDNHQGKRTTGGGWVGEPTAKGET